jgi:hypothetical protein
MQLKLDPRFTKRVQARYDRFEMQVGILQDGPHKNAASAKRGLSSYAGGPIRKKSASSKLTIAEVSEANRKRMDVNYLTDPFSKKSSDIIAFSTSFFKMAAGKASSMRKRVENLMQAIVRNPILRGDYGSNSELTKKIKTFDRYMIDTGQLFKAIKASVKIRGGRD